ncbi:hypothetical protein D3C71_1871560 [compost metagenome]
MRQHGKRLFDLAQGRHSRRNDEAPASTGELPEQRPVGYFAGRDLVKRQIQRLEERQAVQVKCRGQELYAALCRVALQIGVPF